MTLTGGFVLVLTEMTKKAAYMAAQCFVVLRYFCQNIRKYFFVSWGKKTALPNLASSISLPNLLKFSDRFFSYSICPFTDRSEEEILANSGRKFSP